MSRETRTVLGRELAPLDATADRVTRPASIWGSPDRPALPQHLGRVRPDLRPWPIGLRDIRDEVRGRLTVVGAWTPGSGNDHRIVVRCVCGEFLIRRWNTWGKSDERAMCGYCKVVEQRKTHSRLKDSKLGVPQGKHGVKPRPRGEQWVAGTCRPCGGTGNLITDEGVPVGCTYCGGSRRSQVRIRGLAKEQAMRRERIAVVAPPTNSHPEPSAPEEGAE